MLKRKCSLTPTRINALRVIIALIAAALFLQGSFYAGLVAILLFPLEEALDAVDGYIARKRNLATAFGAFLDISTDRLIETIYWFLFLSLHMIPFWIPAFFLIRGTITDLIRVRILQTGKMTSGDKRMMRTWLGRTFVGSYWSRGLLVAVRVVSFCSLQILFLLNENSSSSKLKLLGWETQVLQVLGPGMIYALTAIYVIRGLIIFREGRDELRVFGWTAKPIHDSE
jgi:phosphatidylglycerophosphate synthase